MGIYDDIENLNSSLKKNDLPIIKKIVKYQNNFIDKKSLTNIKQFILQLSEYRKTIKELIKKYERNIFEIDKKILIKKNKNYNLVDDKKHIENILIQLNTANENIKHTLKKIILKIK